MIKGLSFVLLFFVLIGQSYAQNPIPNAGFEVWSGSVLSPTGWGVINTTIPFVGAITTAEKESVLIHGGSFALKLHGGTFPLLPLPIPGIATTGTVNTFTQATSGGFAYSGRPSALKGFYVYQPANQDTARISVTLTHWNDSTNAKEVVASGVKYFRNYLSAYASFFVPLEYFIEGVTPDSATITMYSTSSTNANVSSVLFMDDLEFIQSVQGISLEESKNEVLVFPIPASNTLNFSLPSNDGEWNLQIFNLSGQMVYSSNNIQDKSSITLSYFKKGIYFYRIQNTQQQKSWSGKLSIIN